MKELRKTCSTLLGWRISLAIGVLGVLVVSGCVTKAPMISPFGAPIFHTIAPGDTLWSISKQYGVTVESLMTANNIKDAGRIKTGARLMVPKFGLPSQEKKKEPQPLSTPGNWKYIVIHHSATLEGSAEIFDRQHRQRGFWNGLGYHFVICNGTSGRRDGEIQVGDRWIKQINGAHCNVSNMNEVGIGICLVGDFENGQRVTPRQMESLVSLVRSLQKSYNISADHVVRHSDIKHTTECPGHSFPWWELKYSIIQNQIHMGLFAERDSHLSAQNSQSDSPLHARSFYA